MFGGFFFFLRSDLLFLCKSLFLFSSCSFYLDSLSKIKGSGVDVENYRNKLFCQHCARVGFPLHLLRNLLMSQTTLFFAEFISSRILILFTKLLVKSFGFDDFQWLLLSCLLVKQCLLEEC